MPSDTLVKLLFIPKDNCFSTFTWNITNSKFTYKTPAIPIPTNWYNGDALWVNTFNPNLVYPPNDTVFVPTTTQLDWKSVLCAVSYQLQISLDSTFSNIILDVNNINNHFYNVDNLINNQKYYWRINQSDSEGKQHWSETWSFKTDLKTEKNYQIYPNPSNGQFNIWMEIENDNAATITVYNSIGQLIDQKEIERVGKLITLNLDRFNNGLYIIVFDDGKTQWTEKIIIFK